jgi:crotonobetainyl-CoA:carnitine CoA-transferase CaiB-like acyl-CoA transferase
VGPHLAADGQSLFFHAFNRGKASFTLDLKRPEARGVLEDLARQADGIFNNLRGDLPDRLGLTHDHLKAVNPRIVCAHLSAYGRTGSRRSWPGYDYLMQAEAGYLNVTGEPGSPPTRCGLSLVDYMTGAVAALALLAAVVEARASGRGRDIDVSLFDVALHNLTYLAAWSLNIGATPERAPRSAHPSLTPSQLYRTRDGWIFIMCNKEKFWPVLAQRIGRLELVTDPRFLDFPRRLANRDTLTAILDAAFGERSTADWLAILGGAVPAAPVHDVAEALASSLVEERGLVAEARTSAGAAIKTLSAPIRFGQGPAPPRPAPALGADTDRLLAALGFSPQRIAELRRVGVV